MELKQHKHTRQVERLEGNDGFAFISRDLEDNELSSVSLWLQGELPVPGSLKRDMTREQTEWLAKIIGVRKLRQTLTEFQHQNVHNSKKTRILATLHQFGAGPHWAGSFRRTVLEGMHLSSYQMLLNTAPSNIEVLFTFKPTPEDDLFRGAPFLFMNWTVSTETCGRWVRQRLKQVLEVGEVDHRWQFSQQNTRFLKPGSSS